MRNKIKYNSIDDNQIVHCVICNRDLKKKYFIMKNLYEDCERGKCLYCDWLKRHNNIIPEFEGWTKSEVDLAIKFILTDDSVYLNDLQKLYSNKSLNDICELVVKLHIGNKTTLVKSNCKECGKEIEDFPSVYLKNHNGFCSTECYHKYRSEHILKGKDSPFYNRITTTCSNCGKEIEIIPYNYNQTNENGENFNFCSLECYYQFRSKHYIGENSPVYGKKLSEELKDKLRKSIYIRSKDPARFNSGIQISINHILDNNNIKYEREKVFTYYAVDNYLSENNLIIEVMGNYWHASPLRYNNNKYKLNEKQLEWIKKDKQKHSFIKNHTGINILYLWETDINKNNELCEKLILKYIQNNGLLLNYNSFNYHLDDNKKLVLNDNIILSYQEQKLESYKYLAS